MFVSAVIFKSTFGAKSAINGASVFKNVLHKCILQRFGKFRVWSTNSKSFFTLSQRRFSVSRFNKKLEPLDKNFDHPSTILNNVVIYKYEKDAVFAFVMVFAVVQLIGMITMASNVYNVFCKDLFNPNKSWRTRLWEHKYSCLAIFSGILFGPVIFLCTLLIASRTVKRVILHKGGEKVTFFTYNPIISRRTFTVPLDNVSCRTQRIKGSTLPIKISNRRFFYFLDNDGHFPNEDLFDFTVGLYRDLDK